MANSTLKKAAIEAGIGYEVRETKQTFGTSKTEWLASSFGVTASVNLSSGRNHHATIRVHADGVFVASIPINGSTQAERAQDAVATLVNVPPRTHLIDARVATLKRAVLAAEQAAVEAEAALAEVEILG